MTISKFINSTFVSLTALAFTVQLIIDFSTVNIATSCIILTSVITTLLYFRWSNAFDTHPLSSFAIFGFCVTSLLGALVAQSASWVAVSASLYQPLITFSLLAVYQAIAILAHAIYRIMTSTSSIKPGLLRYGFQKIGVYATPNVVNLWFMGVIGIFFLLLSQVSPVANGLSFLAWSPFLIPIYSQQIGSSYCNAKRNYLLLLSYAVLIALMAMAFNARGMMLAGAATVSLLFLLIGMRSTKQVTGSMLLKLSMVGLFLAVLSWPASNMVTAMAIARKVKFKVPLSEMVTKTIDNFLDPEKLENYNKEIIAREIRSSYDESYIQNPMVARFVITKFHDNAIYFGSKISEKNSDELMRITRDFFWATLPQPLLDAMKIDVDKTKMYFSMGDVLVNLSVGIPLGGEKTGSIFGQGWALFGYMFPIIYFGMCLILFAALDIFSIQSVYGKVELAVIGMLNTWPNFLFGITADSLHHLFIGVVRGVIQSVILYSIVFAIVKLLSKILISHSEQRSESIPNLD